MEVNMTELFKTKEMESKSPRLKWLESHLTRVLTHNAPHLEHLPWCAVEMNAACRLFDGYDLTEQEKTSLPHLMAGYCRLLEDADLVGYGKTENQAISECQRKNATPWRLTD